MAKIWVVEDDSVIAQLVAQLMVIRGHAVTRCCCGGETISNLEAGMRPDLIILDLKMPPPDGNDVLRTILYIPHPPPVVVMTGYPNELHTDLRHIPTAVVCKPFRSEHLYKVVDEALKTPPTGEKSC